jgi:cobalt-zinc-cadmium efflux system protein
MVLALTAGFTAVEIVGGLLTGSLALLADAGHMLSDNLSLGIALFAAWLAQRPATPNKSFGSRRAEILARRSLDLGLRRGLRAL